MPDGPIPSPGGAPGQSPGGAPPAGGPPGGGGGGQGGGMADALTQVDGLLYKMNQAMAKAQVGPDVKSACQAALTAFRQFETLLVKSAGGEAPGGEPDGDEGGGATTTQQAGSSGAVPMTHQAMRQ